MRVTGKYTRDSKTVIINFPDTWNTANITDAAITNAKIADCAADKLTAGTITSKAITLAITEGTGDVKIQAGKTDFGDTTAGFILGIDDSVAGDPAKFEIGNATHSFTWSGTELNITGIINCQAGSIIEGLDATNVAGWAHGSDVTKIDGGDVYTNTITATQIAANTITATQINGGGLGTLTITSGKIAINATDALEIQAATGMKVSAGGDIYLIGHDSNPGTIIFDGTSYDTIVGCKANGTDFGIGPAVDNAASGMFGKTFDGNVWFSCAIWGKEHVDLETANYSIYFDDSEAALRPGVSGSVSLGSLTYKFNDGWLAGNLVVDSATAINTTVDTNNQLKVIMSNTETNNYGIVGAASSAGTNNIGVYASATNGTGSNKHFLDASGNYSDGAAWQDVSNSSRKKLIRDLVPNELGNLYKTLDSLNMKSFRHDGEIPILGYSETEIEIDKVTKEKRPKPILDDPIKAPERFGLIADDPDLPEFLASKDRKGLSGGKLANYALICIKHQKQVIEQLDERLKLLEVT